MLISLPFVFLLTLTIIFFVQYKQRVTLLQNQISKIKNVSPHTTEISKNDFPELLKQYLQKVIINNKKLNYISLTQNGHFWINERVNGAQFRAEQYISALRPMFLWKATIKFAGFPIHVCDQLIGERGKLQANLLHILPIAREEGQATLRGELIRYLAEIVWVPQAINYQRNIIWKEIDKNILRASLTIKTVTATVDYHFNNEGLIDSIYVKDRERVINGKSSQIPWSGIVSNYQIISGIKIPLYSEVSWHLPEKKFTYFKGKIESYNTYIH